MFTVSNPLIKSSVDHVCDNSSNQSLFLGSNEDDGTRTTTLTLKDIDDGKYAGDYTCDFEYSDTENYESEEIEVVVRGRAFHFSHSALFCTVLIFN